MGTVVLGKLEAGTIRTGEQLIVLPNKSLIVVSLLIFFICSRFEYVGQSLFASLFIPKVARHALGLFGHVILQGWSSVSRK
jgi:hypothetical protein